MTKVSDIGELTEQILTELAQSCRQFFDQYPISSFIIGAVCRRLADEYDGQAIPTSRYREINERLCSPLQAVLERPDDMERIEILLNQARILLGESFP